MKITLKFPSDNLHELLDILNHNSIKPSRIIGGAVRDKLLDKDAGDIDIATSILPNEVLTILNQNKIKAVPTGIKFGTVTAIFPDEHFEITTLRKDMECDGRWVKKVAYTDDFSQDAERRDFTINALSYDLYSCEPFDYFSGFEHLKQNKVVFIGVAEKRILEDYLRILRFFRFSIKYAKEIDDEGYRACYKYKDLLLKLSPERITAEMNKIIAAPLSYSVLFSMVKAGIFEILIPGYVININNIVKASEFKQLQSKVKITTEGLYSLLILGNNNFIQKDVYKNFSFSNKARKKIFHFLEVLSLINLDDFIKSIYKLWHEQEQNYVKELIICSYINNQIDYNIFLELTEKFSAQPPNFPIEAETLIKLGHSGRELGLVLNKLYNFWLEKECKITKEELLNKLK